MIFIETERLHLRNLKKSDADTMFDYRNNEICSRYQRDQARDLKGISNVIKRRKDDELSTEHPFMVAVALRETDEMIGEIVVKPTDNIILMGYTFSYKYHRQGYAFEALTELIEILHKLAPDMELICYVEPENIASIRLLEKLGYKSLGYVLSEGAQVFGKWTAETTDEKFAADKS